jgi:hypothetical protein
MTRTGSLRSRPPRGRRRSILALPPAVVVIGIVNLGPNTAAGAVFVAAALAVTAWLLVAARLRERG